MAKSKDVSPKHKLLLEVGRTLFWKYGFKKVSIQEICNEAGISKMTYYRSFEDKIELAKAVFDKEVEKGITTFKQIIEDKTSSPAEKVKRIIAIKQEGVSGISKEFLKDFYGSDETGLKSYIEEKTRETWAKMVDDFKKAQKKGVFRKDMKPEFLIFLSMKVAELLNDQQLNALYKSPQDLLTELSNFFAYGVSANR